MWTCDGVGRFPFEALAAGGRSFPDPAPGFLLSPAASGPQSMDGISADCQVPKMWRWWWW
eukprot:scaffold149759_cov37-Attheya_sp.AAC.1